MRSEILRQTFCNMKKRQEAQENNFGIKFKIGDKFTLYKNFGSQKGENCFIVEISPSGLFFKVNKINVLFSIKTLQSKGSNNTNGYYLIPQPQK